MEHLNCPNESGAVASEPCGRHGRVLHAVYLGMATLPALAGKFRDLTGDPAAPILVASAMMASGVVLLILFRTAQRLTKS